MNLNELPDVFGYEIACEILQISPATFYRHARKGNYDEFVFSPTPNKFLVRKTDFIDWINNGGCERGGEKGKGTAA